MFWLALIVMGVVAAVYVAMPLWANASPRRPLGVGSGLVVLIASGVVYAVIGSPDTPSGRGAPLTPQELPAIEEMIAGLAARLENEPDDLNGWQMLGRSNMAIGRYAEAAAAYARAIELESSRNPNTLVARGEALLASGGQTLTPEIVSLFESALALDPNQPAALFWSGIASANRGDVAEAADRWERLLGTNPPPEIREIIGQRIAEWRGEPAPVAETAPIEQTGAVVAASVALSDDAAAGLSGDATVFIIARDPAQPSPPIAVIRRRLSELPAVVALGDADSMIPGRSLSAFAEFELVARVSVSGQPAAQSGDWFGSLLVRPAEDSDVSLSIDHRVP